MTILAYTHTVSVTVSPEHQLWLGLLVGRVSVEYRSSVDWVTTNLLINISVNNFVKAPYKINDPSSYHFCDCLKFWVFGLSYISLLLSLLAVISIHVLSMVLCLNQARGEYLTKFNTGRLHPEVQPLTLLYTIWAEKVPLLYTFYWKKVLLSHTYFRKSWHSHFHVGVNK